MMESSVLVGWVPSTPDPNTPLALSIMILREASTSEHNFSKKARTSLKPIITEHKKLIIGHYGRNGTSWELEDYLS